MNFQTIRHSETGGGGGGNTKFHGKCFTFLIY